MLLLPIGQERNEVRRIPWVSAILIGLNVLVFFAQRAGGHEDLTPQLRERGGAVARYLFEHPYLDVPDDLRPVIPEDLRAELMEARAAYLKTTSTPVPMVVRAQRQELQSLSDAFLAVTRKTPPNQYGFVPAHPTVRQAISSLFVHGGLLHLLGNMLFLFVTGPFLEDAFGRLLFGVLYLTSGLVAVGTHGWMFPDSTVPLVGASGAIAGVMGAFLIRLGTSRIQFLFLPIIVLPWIRFRFLLPAYVVLPLWLSEQFVSAGQVTEAQGVAWWAHIGGDVRGAPQSYVELVKRFPAEPASLRALLRGAEILEAQGNRSGAEAALRRALEHPACAGVWEETVKKRLGVA